LKKKSKIRASSKLQTGRENRTDRPDASIPPSEQKRITPNSTVIHMLSYTQRYACALHMPNVHSWDVARPLSDLLYTSRLIALGAAASRPVRIRWVGAPCPFHDAVKVRLEDGGMIDREQPSPPPLPHTSPLPNIV